MQSSEKQKQAYRNLLNAIERLCQEGVRLEQLGPKKYMVDGSERMLVSFAIDITPFEEVINDGPSR